MVTNNPVYHFFHTPGNPGPFLIRMAVAAIFFYHGAQKALGWFGGPGWDTTLASWTTALGLPAFLGAIVIASELLISVSLFFGFLTRLSGLGVVAIMSGAVVVLVRGGAGIMDLELPVLVCTAGLALFFLGGGALSLDRAISRNILPVVG